MRFANEGDMYPGQEWLWEQALNRAVNGKRGQRVLRDLERALLELPEKRLIDGLLCRGGEVCVVGAYVAHKRVEAGESREAVLKDLEEKIRLYDDGGYYDGWEAEEATLHAARQHDMLPSITSMFAFANDDLYQCTPEERYERLLRKVQSLIIEEPVAV